MKIILRKVSLCVTSLLVAGLTVTAQRPRLVVQTGHFTQVNSVAFSPDGKTIASASTDESVKLWDVSTGTELRTLKGQRALAFSPNGKTLASDSGWGVKLWEVSTGAELRYIERRPELRYIENRTVNLVAFSPDGKTLAICSSFKTVTLWTVSTGTELQTFKGDSNLKSIAFSPDGKTLTAGSWEGMVTLWDVPTGTEMRTVKGHSEPVTSVAFSPDGKMLASGSWDQSVKLWDVSTGAELHTFKALPFGVNSIAFSPNGKTLAGGGDVLKLWDLSTGATLYTVRFDTMDGHPERVKSLAFSPDGKTLTTGSSDGTVKLLEASTGKDLHTLRGHSYPVTTVAFSPDGRALLRGGFRSIKLWEVASGTKLRTLFAGSLSPNWTTLATNTYEEIQLWDTSSGAKLKTIKAPSFSFSSLSFSPDGRFVVGLAMDTSSKVSPRTAKLWDIATGAEVRTFGGSSWVDSISFSPDGNTLATSGYGTIKLWEVSTGTELRAIKTHPNLEHSVTFSPNGRNLATGGGHAIQLWDVSTGIELRTIKAPWVGSVVFSPDGKTLASCSGPTVTLWEVSTGTELSSLKGHSGGVNSIAFSLDNKYLVSGSTDTTIKVWEVFSGKELANLIALDEDDWVVVTPDGHFDASPGAEKLMHYVLNTPERGYEVIQFDQLKFRYYEPGLLQKILRGEPLRDVTGFRDVRLTPDVQEVTSSSQKPSNTKRTVKLTNRGGGIGRVQVFVNDREFIEDARDRKLKQNPEVKEAFITFDLAGASVIAGEQPRVKVIAWNYDPQAKDEYKGYISSRGTELVYTPPPNDASKTATKPELYAIIGGISDYDGDKLDLRFAAKDAEDIAKAIAVGGKNLFGVERLHVTLLATGDYPSAIAPTKENFQKAFAAYAQQAKPEDIFFVYLSGHGITLGHGSDTYLYLTKDANTTDVEQLKRDSDLLARATISSEELKRWFKSVNALKQVLILDTCAAGAAAAKLSSGAKDVQTDAIRAIDQMQDVTGFHVLMGSTADAVSYEATQYGQGLLTYSLLQGIKSGEALEESGRVDVSRLFQYAANKVPQLARNIGGVQRPEIRGPSGDSKSFALGLINSVGDKKEIPLAMPRPLILRPVLQNQKLGYDNLKLTVLLRDALREESYATVRGRDAAPLVFVDADEMPDAIIPSGNYTIEGETVRVTLNLVRNDEVLKSFTIEGQRNDLAGVVKRLIADFTAGAR